MGQGRFDGAGMRSGSRDGQARQQIYQASHAAQLSVETRTHSTPPSTVLCIFSSDCVSKREDQYRIKCSFDKHLFHTCFMPGILLSKGKRA